MAFTFSPGEYYKSKSTVAYIDDWGLTTTKPTSDADRAACIGTHTLSFTQHYYSSSTMYSAGSFIPDSKNNNYALGSTDNRWNELWVNKLNGNELSTASEASTDSDRKLKNTIEYDISKYDKVFDALKPVSYQYNNSNSGRTHLGFIAQDVQESIKNAGLTDKDYSIVTIDGNGFDAEQGIVTNEEDTVYRLRYSQLHALEVRQIQLLKQEIKELKAEIEELKKLKTE